MNHIQSDPANDLLTIGVISKNGLPFLTDCLSSLPIDIINGKRVEVILVDCCSTDETLKTMVEFSKHHSNIRVFTIEGHANAAVARNVVLDHAAGHYLMLVDGDTILSQEFLEKGIEQIEAGSADAVCGTLHEQRYDTKNNPSGEIFYRIHAKNRQYVRTSGGNIFLGPRVIMSGIRFDEMFRRGQDRDFSLRLSEYMQLLQIPISMGIHLTHHYYSPKRISEFYQHSYARPLGFLIRKHGVHLDRLWLILKLEIGPAVGFCYYFLLMTSIAMKNVLILAGLILLMTIDYIRFILQHRTHEFFPIRLVSPVMILEGLLGRGETRSSYIIKEVHPQL